MNLEFDATASSCVAEPSVRSSNHHGASGRDGVGGALKSVDLYAKMPRELAEGTYLGGIFSILLMFLFVSLFLFLILPIRYRLMFKRDI